MNKMMVLYRTGFVLPTLFGIASLIPNMMISDSGSKQSIRASNVCLCGSLLNISAGVVGLSGIFINIPIKYSICLIILGMFSQIAGLFMIKNK